MDSRFAKAGWADPALVEERYRYRDGDYWLGRSLSDKQIPLGYQDGRNICIVGGSPDGKNASSIIPNLCVWPGSVVVVDPGGENATTTATRRGNGSAHCTGLGQAVHVLDPFRAAHVDDAHRSRFNPLDALDPGSDESIDQATLLADAIVVMPKQSDRVDDPFWDVSARAMVRGLLLHVLTAPEYEGRRNLITLRKLITRGDWEAVEALRSAGEQSIPSAHALLFSRVAANPAFDGLVAGLGDTFTNMVLNSAQQFESIREIAALHTEFIDSPGMQRMLERSDFDLADLKTKAAGMSLYLCLPQRFMNTHHRWLRIILALTVAEMETLSEKPATGFPTLMVLHEFASLSRMEVIENTVALAEAFGLKFLFSLQSLEQLKAVYKDNWETFLPSAGLKLFFDVHDHFSQGYISKLIASGCVSASPSPAAPLSPEGIGTLFASVPDRDHADYPGLGLALIAGQKPVVFRRANYFDDPRFIGCFQPRAEGQL